MGSVSSSSSSLCAAASSPPRRCAGALASASRVASRSSTATAGPDAGISCGGAGTIIAASVGNLRGGCEGASVSEGAWACSAGRSGSGEWAAWAPWAPWAPTDDAGSAPEARRGSSAGRAAAVLPAREAGSPGSPATTEGAAEEAAAGVGAARSGGRRFSDAEVAGAGSGARGAGVAGAAGAPDRAPEARASFAGGTEGAARRVAARCCARLTCRRAGGDPDAPVRRDPERPFAILTLTSTPSWRCLTCSITNRPRLPFHSHPPGGSHAAGSLT